MSASTRTWVWLRSAIRASARVTCKAVVSPRARPGVVNGLGVWWRKLGVRGTNVNEVTSQALTDLGRAPTFYDCLVEVEAVDATDAVA